VSATEVEVSYTIDHPEYGEVDVLVYGSRTPVVRGRYYGPPELCYPDEGGEIEITSVVIDGGDHDGEEIDIDALPDVKAITDRLEEQIEEAAIDEDVRRYEDAMEAKAEAAREARWDRD
jgi:hypothetical protein